MTTSTQNFGTNTPLTVTSLHSLTDTNYWQSDVIDNGTIKGFWMELFITIKTSTAVGDAAGTVDVYLAGSNDGGTTFAGGATGTEGAYTPVTDGTSYSEQHLRFLRSLPCNAVDTTARTFSYQIVVHNIGEDFSIIIGNQTNNTFDAATNAVAYRIHKIDAA